MGCIGSKKTFVVNSNVEGQDASAMEVFHLLGLSQRDVDLLYTAFWDIDADNSGLIRPIELFNYFEVEETKFNLSIFSLFDEDGSGMINFMEFVCTLWNLLTTPETNYGALAFLIKDPTAQAQLSFSNIREILEMMHNKKIDKDPALSTIYNQMRKELDGIFSIDTFNKWAAANPSTMSPLMMLQLHIRFQIIGESFWNRLSKARKDHPDQGQLDYVNKLQEYVITKNETFRQRQIEEEEDRQRLERLGKGKHGDVRDNITRKQSILLRHFNLKQMSFAKGGKQRNRKLSRVIPSRALEEEIDDTDRHGQEELMNVGAKDRKLIKAHANNTNNNNAQQIPAPRQRRSFIKKPNLAPDQKTQAPITNNKGSAAKPASTSSSKKKSNPDKYQIEKAVASSTKK